MAAKKLVVMLSGKMRSGKNYMAETMRLFLETETRGDLKVDLFSFAQPLKQTCEQAFSPLVAHINDTVEKSVVTLRVMCEHESFRANMDVFKHVDQLLTDGLTTRGANWYDDKNGVTRAVLQAVGTNIVRNIDPDYWAKATRAAIEHSNCNVAIITDWRFPNEADIIAAMPDINLVTIRLLRNPMVNTNSVGHASEVALDNENIFDYIIDNTNSTLEDFKQSSILIAKELLFIYTEVPFVCI